MNLTISGHHVDITQSMRHYVKSKLDKLERHSRDLDSAHVILSVEKTRQKAEATVAVSGTRLYADTTEEDMYAAIDLLTDKLDRQLIKAKEKARSTHARNVHKGDRATLLE